MTSTEQAEGSRPPGNRWSVALWPAAALLLLVPLIAMQVTDEVNWTGSDFVFAAVLLFGSLGAYELAKRAAGETVYRAGAALAIAGAFFLTWVNAAVGLTDGVADGVFLGVPAVGAIGALLARFRPSGMARAMLAVAFALVLVAVVALLAGVVPAHNSTFKVLAMAVFFSLPFAGSALLFRRAARRRLSREAA